MPGCFCLRIGDWIAIPAYTSYVFHIFSNLERLETQEDEKQLLAVAVLSAFVKKWLNGFVCVTVSHAHLVEFAICTPLYPHVQWCKIKGCLLRIVGGSRLDILKIGHTTVDVSFSAPFFQPYYMQGVPPDFSIRYRDSGFQVLRVGHIPWSTIWESPGNDFLVGRWETLPCDSLIWYNPYSQHSTSFWANKTCVVGGLLSS